MDTEAQAALRGYDISWQTREGAPYSANDLNRVSAGSAETIILMRPENGRVRSTFLFSKRSTQLRPTFQKMTRAIAKIMHTEEPCLVRLEKLELVNLATVQLSWLRR